MLQSWHGESIFIDKLIGIIFMKRQKFFLQDKELRTHVFFVFSCQLVTFITLSSSWRYKIEYFYDHEKSAAISWTYFSSEWTPKKSENAVKISWKNLYNLGRKMMSIFILPLVFQVLEVIRKKKTFSVQEKTQHLCNLIKHPTPFNFRKCIRP